VARAKVKQSRRKPAKVLRKDGTLMRSGSFDNGVQVGDWVTHDKDGRVVKVTRMTRK
jgi:hypothetical protein